MQWMGSHGASNRLDRNRWYETGQWRRPVLMAELQDLYTHMHSVVVLRDHHYDANMHELYCPTRFNINTNWRAGRANGSRHCSLADLLRYDVPGAWGHRNSRCTMCRRTASGLGSTYTSWCGCVPTIEFVKCASSSTQSAC